MRAKRRCNDELNTEKVVRVPISGHKGKEASLMHPQAQADAENGCLILGRNRTHGTMWYVLWRATLQADAVPFPRYMPVEADRKMTRCLPIGGHRKSPQE